MASWKKALIFGGAVVLLSACDQSVTAPTGLSRVESKAAAKAPSTGTKTTTLSTSTSGELGPGCGIVVAIGDSTCVPTGGQ